VKTTFFKGDLKKTSLHVPTSRIWSERKITLGVLTSLSFLCAYANMTLVILKKWQDFAKSR
jgi:hypothetical protein